MIIKTLFNPMRLSVNGVETPVMEQSYLDECGCQHKFKYAIVNGEKVFVERRWDLEEKFIEYKSVDLALAKVEEARLKNIEDAKDDQPVDPIDPITP